MPLILIADDDPLVCEVVRSTLSEQGHVVGVVGNGEEAVRAFDADMPDLLILDCAMPELSGVDALRQIRTTATGTSTPVLMLTARRSSTDEEIAASAGANDYLRKPFSPIQLLVRVELLLAKSPSARLSTASG